MSRNFLTYIFLVFLSALLAQKKNSFIWPLDSPRVLTANYGELRPNHFHAGLDIATSGQIGMPVFAAEEGYVSRVKVSSTGYGKCVYITHPNGLVTVYAHLNSFSIKIDDEVKKEQYWNQLFEIDFKPKPKAIRVKKNEIIALSGNTGGSTGPHLHFEIRDEKKETPFNPLLFYKMNDNTPPAIQQIAFYNLADTNAPKFLNALRLRRGDDDFMTIEQDSIVVEQSILGLAFSGFDRFTEGGSPNNIYSIEIFLDDKPVYHHELNNIDFADTRYINEFTETVGGVKYQKCFLPTLYPEGFCKSAVNRGRFILLDNNFHTVKFIAKDESGNETKLKFTFRPRVFNFFAPPSVKSDLFVNCNTDFFINKNGLQVFIPKGALFYSTPLIFENTIETTGKLIILPTEASVRTQAIVGFKIPDKYLYNRTKLVLKSGNSLYSPINRGDSVFYAVKNFGWFQLMIDNEAPKIKTALTEKKFRKMKNIRSFSFQIRDNLTGISKYSLKLNGKWVLAEYDLKSETLTCTLDDDSPKKIQKLRLDVEDKVGNKSALEYSLNK